MNYLSALYQATTRIEHQGVEDETEAQASLRLACLAFEAPIPEGREWALLASELLTALDELYPDPVPIAIVDVQPSLASRQVHEALFRLVLALAAGYERAGGQLGIPARRRFAYAATANRLRAAVKALE